MVNYFYLFALFFVRFFKLTDLTKHSIQLAQKLASIFYKGFFEQKSENGKIDSVFAFYNMNLHAPRVGGYG